MTIRPALPFATLVAVAAVAAAAVLAICSGFQEAVAALEAPEPAIAVDAHGNLHINTSASSNTSVFVNGRDLAEEVRSLSALLSVQVSAQLSTSAAYDDMLRALVERMNASEAAIAHLRCPTQGFTQRPIVPGSTDRPSSVFAADLDGDGDIDVLSASSLDNKIAWYENQDGFGSFPSQTVISTTTQLPQAVFAADLDGDDDMDVLSASSMDRTLAWYRNDGQGTFSSQITITDDLRGIATVHAADLDGDGDNDVLSASALDGKVVWFNNTNGQGSFSPANVITATASGATSVFTADLDGDGDLDVLSASYGDDTIAWYENTDGRGTFSPQKVISSTALAAYSVHAADLDGDGDMDVLSASAFDNTVAWFENKDGEGSFSRQNNISMQADGAIFVIAADIDGDGDMDVVSASSVDDKVAWYENTNGRGSFTPEKIITSTADEVVAVFAADLDGDGDVDVLSASASDDTLAWYENRCR